MHGCLHFSYRFLSCPAFPVPRPGLMPWKVTIPPWWILDEQSHFDWRGKTGKKETPPVPTDAFSIQRRRGRGKEGIGLPQGMRAPGTAPGIFDSALISLPIPSFFRDFSGSGMAEGLHTR
jgi:hypothetical protein